MFNGKSNAPITIRAIINRGGEQGAQHSQMLHSWFSHVPGLRVVMPSTVADARDLLISSVLCPDPVLYIDDRWLYELEDEIPKPEELNLREIGPNIIKTGNDITIVSSGYSTELINKCNVELKNNNIDIEIIDLRILNPLNPKVIINSVRKTRNLIVIDGGWKTCGYASEVITKVVETIEPDVLINKPVRITLPDCPAPTAKNMEKAYYPSENKIIQLIKKQFK